MLIERREARYRSRYMYMLIERREARYRSRYMYMLIERREARTRGRRLREDPRVRDTMRSRSRFVLLHQG